MSFEFVTGLFLGRRRPLAVFVLPVLETRTMSRAPPLAGVLLSCRQTNPFTLIVPKSDERHLCTIAKTDVQASRNHRLTANAQSPQSALSLIVFGTVQDHLSGVAPLSSMQIHSYECMYISRISKHTRGH